MGGTGWNWQSKLIVACTCGGVVVGGVGWLASEHPITRPRTASGWCFWLRLGELFLVLELDDLVLLAFRSAAWSDRYGLVEELVVERRSLALLNFHILGDKLDIFLSLLSVCDVLWRGPSLLGATSARVLR